MSDDHCSGLPFGSLDSNFFGSKVEQIFRKENSIGVDNNDVFRRWPWCRTSESEVLIRHIEMPRQLS